MQYRQMQQNYRNCVVGASMIHGIGLFVERDFDAGEMVIEYVGELIRHSVADIREKYYDRKGTHVAKSRSRLVGAAQQR